MIWVPRSNLIDIVEVSFYRCGENLPRVSIEKLKKLQKLWINFEKPKNRIFSKTAQPILMAKIYVIEDAQKVMKWIKNQSRWLEGGKKNYCNFLGIFWKWSTSRTPVIFSYFMFTIRVTIYIFSKMIREVLHRYFFGPYNVWSSMRSWANSISNMWLIELSILMEHFSLITYNISLIFIYLLHSRRYSTLYMDARVSQ